MSGMEFHSKKPTPQLEALEATQTGEGDEALVAVMGEERSFVLNDFHKSFGLFFRKEG